jgi:uncharacterized protein
MVRHESGPLMASAETSIQSPCNKVCVMHPTLRLCIGCGRSLDEIAGWAAYDAAARARIMAQLPARLAALPDARRGTPSVAAAR